MSLAPFTLTRVKISETRPYWPGSFGRPHLHLRESIKSIGLIRPPLLVQSGGAPEFRLISGGLRLRALADLGHEKAPALLLPPETPPAELFETALCENFERGLNEAELALAWNFLRNNLPAPEALRLSACLGLDKSPKIRAWAEKAATLPEAALTDLAQGRLDLEIAARLSAWEPGDLAAVLDVFRQFAPSKQKKRLWLDWLEDISRRESLSPLEILKSPEMTEALGATEEAARQALWRRRHPELAELSARRHDQIKALRLPKNMLFTADPTFEDLKFNLNLAFTNQAELAALTQKAAALPDDENMLKILNEGSL